MLRTKQVETSRHVQNEEPEQASRAWFPHSGDARSLRRHVVLVAVLLLAVGVRLDSLTAPPLDFAPARQSYDALRARIIYLDGSKHLPAWKRAVLDNVRRQARQIEPPVMEHVAAAGYRLVGSEQLWIPRLVSVLFWLIGGGFLYRLAMRLSGEPGPLISLALYLLLPFAIFGSRSFQPDPLMVMLTLGALLAILRFHEQPSRSRLAVAAASSALAILSKPAIPVFFLWAAFLAVAVVRQGLRRGLADRSSIAFAVISFAPAGAYYLYGTFAAGFLAGHTSGSLSPGLLEHFSFWRGWGTMIGNVIAYPLSPHPGFVLLLLDVALAALMLLGLRAARGRVAGALLVGLWLGYLAFGLAFTVHISTHIYYSLPLVPIVALSLGPLGHTFLERLRAFPLAAQTAVLVTGCLIAAAAGWKVHQRIVSGEYRAQAQLYARVGALVRHTTHSVYIDRLFESPLLYYGWIAGSVLAWPGQNLPPGYIHQRLRQVTAEDGPPRFLIITAMDELKTQRQLQVFVRGLPVVARTHDYAIFALTRA